MIALRYSLLRHLMGSKFHGRVTGVLQAWPIASVEPHRTTLWRWLNGKTPTPERILQLAGAFDLDPFALFDKTPKGYAALCRALARTIGAKRATCLSSELEWVLDFIAPNEDWPPREVSTTYFHRNWNVISFCHPARNSRNYFQRLTITSPAGRFGEPLVWHFAFRVPNATFPVWTPYGFVERRNEEISLYHFRGYSARAEVQPDIRTFVVETWFGLGAADFRVASLHPFNLVLDEASASTVPCVRFP